MVRNSVFLCAETRQSKYFSLLLKADLMTKHLNISTLTNKQEQRKPDATDLISQSSYWQTDK